MRMKHMVDCIKNLIFKLSILIVYIAIEVHVTVTE